MRISLKQFCEDMGLEPTKQALYDYIEEENIHIDSVVPAVCSEGCEVEPDGHCPHDAPSLLLKLGMI